MTIQRLVDYVMAHRRGKAFEGWSPIEIAEAFLEAVEDMALVYCVDEMGNVTGVGHGRKYRKDNVFYVCNVVTTHKGALPQLLMWFKNLHPNYKLEARRRGKLKHYNTSRLLKKFNIT